MKHKNRNDRIYVLRIKDDLFRRLAKAAKHQDLNAAQLIRRAIEHELEVVENTFSKTLREVGERVVTGFKPSR